MKCKSESVRKKREIQYLPEIRTLILWPFIFYIIKELVQPKMSLNREFLIWKERGQGRERERGAGWQAGQQAGIFKVRLGLGVLEGRDRNTERQGEREK